MGIMKHYLMELSEAMGLGGEITDEVYQKYEDEMERRMEYAMESRDAGIEDES